LADLLNLGFRFLLTILRRKSALSEKKSAKGRGGLPVLPMFGGAEGLTPSLSRPQPTRLPAKKTGPPTFRHVRKIPWPLDNSTHLWRNNQRLFRMFQISVNKLA
jgi:hypothetical protein